jgi:hypothetical protein
MIPIFQENNHDPGNGVWGDCHRAALASLLELPLHRVPHFGDGGPDGEVFHERVCQFLLPKGYVPLTVAYYGDESDPEQLGRVLWSVGETNPGVFYLLGGQSTTGVNHTVICQDDHIVHDPARKGGGIVAPLDTGYYEVTFLGSAKFMGRPKASRAATRQLTRG